ncbi:hypothetical protein QO034_06425 [Sedimentitalea sp. JM2-8]|uniref:Uncharacterized protein n=1 Tax=Sedimentitalea xiamensis TaxID=3050037 RepID=A0ABT7FCA8_9RHOB|nr:hypothetical protein [Sedimentitalea xiamensis]MDK3072739.1 hypothetical protein [Sedimentitalea xiamensis]
MAERGRGYEQRLVRVEQALVELARMLAALLPEDRQRIMTATRHLPEHGNGDEE